jgi:hypothetical protein
VKKIGIDFVSLPSPNSILTQIQKERIDRKISLDKAQHERIYYTSSNISIDSKFGYDLYLRRYGFSRSST